MGDYYCAGSLDTHVVFGIFVASLRAVGCATTLASAGLWLARQGVMTPALSKGLSQLSVKLAIPCLLFSSVVPGVSWHVLSYAWPLLLLPAVHLLLGVLLGCLTALIVKPPGVLKPAQPQTTRAEPEPLRYQTAPQLTKPRRSPARRAIPARHRGGVYLWQHDRHPDCVALGAATVAGARRLRRARGPAALPLATGICAACAPCTHHECPLLLHCTHPLLAPSAQLLTYPLLQWTLGLALMSFNRRFGTTSALDSYPTSPALDSDPGVSAHGVSAFAEDGDEGVVLPTVLWPTTPGSGAQERPSLYRPPRSCEAEDGDEPEGLLRYTGAVPLRHARHGVRVATAASSSHIPMMSEAEDEASVQFARMRPALSVSERVHALGSLVQTTVQTSASRDNAVRLCRRAGVLLQQLLVPPVVGVSLGALVGMLGRGLVLPPEVAPLGWLFMATSKLGAAAVPINLILLGAALSQGPLRGELPRLNSFGVVLARLVLMPLCGLAVARFLASRISVPAEVADPFWLVCLIVTCTPTGNNIVVLCELAGDNKARSSQLRARPPAPCAPRAACSALLLHYVASPCSEIAARCELACSRPTPTRSPSLEPVHCLALQHACSTTIFYQYTAAPLLLPFVLTMFVVFICRTREGHQGLTLDDPTFGI